MKEGVFMNKTVNTNEAINEIINLLEKADGNILLIDTLSDKKICLDRGSVQLLRAYYISKREHYG